MKNIESFIVRLIITVIIIVSINIVYFNPLVSSEDVFSSIDQTNVDKNIPKIKYYNVLEDVYESSKNGKHLLNFTKEIYSVYEALSVRPGMQDGNDDLVQLSNCLWKLFDGTTKVIIEPIPVTQNKNTMKMFRNGESHGNYYCRKYPETKHTTWYETLIQILSSEKEKQNKVINVGNDDWVIWNWNWNRKKLVFCYIIKDTDFRALYEKFKFLCNKAIENARPSANII